MFILLNKLVKLDFWYLVWKLYLRTTSAYCCLGILHAKGTEIQCVEQGWVSLEHAPLGHLGYLSTSQPVFRVHFLLLNSLPAELIPQSSEFSRCCIVYIIKRITVWLYLMNSMLFLLCLSMESMRKWGLKKLEMWEFSYLTMPLSEKRKEGMTWTHVNVQKWGWEYSIHKKQVRERETQFATFCHENFQEKAFSESLRIIDAFYFRKGSRRSEWISKLLA